jgi:hypothetical protein
MQLMTITYPNGTVRKAILLSYEQHEIRVAAPGCDDVLTFTRIVGAWMSEQLEPVIIEFEWQRRQALRTSGDDLSCPEELAAA